MVLEAQNLYLKFDDGSVSEHNTIVKNTTQEEKDVQLELPSWHDLERAVQQGLKLPIAQPFTSEQVNKDIKQEAVFAAPSVAVYFNFFQTQHERIQSLEEQLSKLNKEKEELEIKLTEVRELLNKKGEHIVCEPHPFHKFLTRLEDDYQELNLDIIYNSDAEETSSDPQEPYLLDYVPESPPRKKRKISAFVGRTAAPIRLYEEVEKKQKKRRKSVDRRSLSSANDVTNNGNTPEIPDSLGSLDTSKLVIWRNQIFALSKSFPEKNRLQVMKDRYESQMNSAAYVLIEGEDLKRLKQTNSNVAGHARQLSLYTMPFIYYYIEHEDDEY
jgi:hypothetical protein